MVYFASALVSSGIKVLALDFLKFKTVLWHVRDKLLVEFMIEIGIQRLKLERGSSRVDRQ